MSVEDAIAAAQAFSAALDSRFESERSAIEARAAEAKDKLASGLLDLKEQAQPQAPPQPAYDPFASGNGMASHDELSTNGADNGAFDAPQSMGDDFDPFAADQPQAEAPRGVSFEDFANEAPQPNLDMPPGEDDVILDDDGIPTWQEP